MEMEVVSSISDDACEDSAEFFIKKRTLHGPQIGLVNEPQAFAEPSANLTQVHTGEDAPPPKA